MGRGWGDWGMDYECIKLCDMFTFNIAQQTTKFRQLGENFFIYLLANQATLSLSLARTLNCSPSLLLSLSL